MTPSRRLLVWTLVGVLTSVALCITVRTAFREPLAIWYFRTGLGTFNDQRARDTLFEIGPAVAPHLCDEYDAHAPGSEIRVEILYILAELPPSHAALEKFLAIAVDHNDPNNITALELCSILVSNEKEAEQTKRLLLRCIQTEPVIGQAAAIKALADLWPYGYTPDEARVAIEVATALKEKTRDLMLIVAISEMARAAPDPGIFREYFLSFADSDDVYERSFASDGLGVLKEPRAHRTIKEPRK